MSPKSPPTNPSAAETARLPLGFRAGHGACGIKANSALDLALFVSDVPACSAGVFTQNRVVGAPVKVSRTRVGRSTSRAVLMNSGNSNACTGDRGIADAQTMTATVADQLGCEPDDVLVCSTGVIGRFLPIEKITAGIPSLVESLGDSPESMTQAATAMMTTDTFCKTVSREVVINGKTVTVSGAAKGAAMIAPNMATMLSVIMTDAAISLADADRLLRLGVDPSFNCISIDGHTSTSDTVILLANGASGVSLDPETEPLLADLIQQVCTALAQMIIHDAEGADHFVTVDVSGLRTVAEARVIAKAICEGDLVKTAITGNDPNWGRIVSAAGYTGVEFEESDVSLWLNGFPLYQAGTPVPFEKATVSEAMRSGNVHIDLRFTLGEAHCRMWTSDLTAEYVRLNSDYTT